MRTGHVRTRAEFTALRTRGVRSRRRGAVLVTYVAPPPVADLPANSAPPEVRVAFVIGRPVGSAVTRNRLRRRLRAALGELAPAPGTYLVGATPEAAGLPYGTLRDQLAAALTDVGART
jgi:ribonuclease P protein component